MDKFSKGKPGGASKTKNSKLPIHVQQQQQQQNNNKNNNKVEQDRLFLEYYLIWKPKLLHFHYQNTTRYV